MKRIGLLSDTHSWWDDRYLQYFEQCDEIWHAGDIGSVDVAMRLQEFRPAAICACSSPPSCGGAARGPTCS